MSAVIFSPSSPRLLDHRDDRVHLRPVGLAGRLEVIDLGRDARLAADANQLVDRFDQPVALAAHVRDVLAAVLRRDLAQLDQLLGRGVEGRRVDQRRADAERARFHLLPHERAHLARAAAAVGFWSSRPMTCSRIVVAPTNEATFGETPRFSSSRRYSASVVHVMSYLMSPCSSTMPLLHRVVERAHRAAFAEDLERHALADVALRAAVGEQRLGRPREHVDEAGRDGQARWRRSTVAPSRCEVADRGDAVAADADVGRGGPAPPVPS